MFFIILSRLLCQVNRLNRVLRLLSPEYVRHTCQTGTPLSRSKIQTLQPFAFWQRLLWHPSTETSSTSHHVVALPCVYIYIYSTRNLCIPKIHNEDHSCSYRYCHHGICLCTSCQSKWCSTMYVRSTGSNANRWVGVACCFYIHSSWRFVLWVADVFLWIAYVNEWMELLVLFTSKNDRNILQKRIFYFLHIDLHSFPPCLSSHSFIHISNYNSIKNGRVRFGLR